jgi:hypothetical protein
MGFMEIFFRCDDIYQYNFRFIKETVADEDPAISGFSSSSLRSFYLGQRAAVQTRELRGSRSSRPASFRHVC